MLTEHCSTPDCCGAPQLLQQCDVYWDIVTEFDTEEEYTEVVIERSKPCFIYPQDFMKVLCSACGAAWETDTGCIIVTYR